MDEINTTSGSLSSSLIGNSILGPKREKFWHEMSAEEKLERLGNVLEYVIERVSDIEKDVTQLNEHQHGPQGNLLVPIQIQRDFRMHHRTNPLNRDKVLR